MGDGKIRRHAILINTDTEDRHLKNIERATKTLEEGSYEVHALNPKSLGDKQYQIPTRQDLEAIVRGLQIDDDDQLVIYYTGHGLDGDITNDGKRISQDYIHQTVGKLPHGQRTVIMDACYTGNSAERWHNDKTLFVSPDWKGRQVACQLFAPNLWADKNSLVSNGADSNKDGLISMQERFAYTAGIYKREFPSALPIYLKGQGYSDIGFGTKDASAVFPKNMIVIKTAKGLHDQLSKLRPGQFAVVTFAADWCPACKDYLPVFTELAKKQDGSVLNIWIQPKNDLERDFISKEYGISQIPTVILTNHEGRFIEVRDRNKPLDDIFRLVLSDKVILNWAIERFNSGEFGALNHICTIAKNNPELMTPESVKTIIEGVKKDDPYAAETALHLIQKRPELFGTYKGQLHLAAKSVYDRHIIAKLEHENGLKYYRMKQFDQAITHFEKAIQLFPKFAGTHLMLGRAYYLNGDYERAANFFDMAYAIKPDYSEAVTDLVGAYLRLGRNEKARSLVDNIFSKNKDSAFGHFLLCYTLFHEGNFEKSFHHANIAFDSRNDLEQSFAARLYVMRGLLYETYGDRKNARHHFVEADKIVPGNALAAQNYRMMLIPIDKVQIDTGVRVFPAAGGDAMGAGLKVSTRWPMIVETPSLRLAPRYSGSYTGYNQGDDSKNWIGLSAGLEVEFIHKLLRFNISTDAGYDFQADPGDEDPVGRVIINQGLGFYYKVHLNLELGFLAEYQYRVGDTEAMNIFLGPSLVYRTW